MLFLQLFHRIFTFVIGFQCKAYQHPVSFDTAQFGCNIVRLAQGKGPLGTLLFDLRNGNLRRGVIGHRGTHHRSVATGKGIDCRPVHLFGRQDIHPLHPLRHRQSRTPADEYHFSTAAGQFGGNGVPHFTRGMVRDIAHRIDRFERRSGRHHQLTAFQRSFNLRFFTSEIGAEHLDDPFRLLHAAFAFQTAGKLPRSGLDNMIAVAAQRADITPSRRMGEHVEVHRRSHEYRATRRKVSSEQ